MAINSMTQQTMISTRGSLKYVNEGDVPTMQARGWKIVSNPKRSYYPEFDQQAGGKSAPETIADDLSDDDILPFEEV